MLLSLGWFIFPQQYPSFSSPDVSEGGEDVEENQPQLGIVSRMPDGNSLFFKKFFLLETVAGDGEPKADGVLVVAICSRACWSCHARCRDPGLEGCRWMWCTSEVRDEIDTGYPDSFGMVLLAF